DYHHHGAQGATAPCHRDELRKLPDKRGVK
ncbi:unnamed protein product, partial [marine sediment metagenome]